MIHPRNAGEVKTIKAFLSALDIVFELVGENEQEQPDNKEFVQKIENSRNDIKEGRYKAVKTEDLWM